MMTALLTHFGWDAERIFEAADIEFDEIPGFLARQLVRIRDPLAEVTDRQWKWMEKTGTQILVANRRDYPEQLFDIPDPPALLFMRGSLTAADHSGVGIVGSRNATPYGLTVAERISGELAGHGVTVISGGAVGIDTAAHRGALHGGGRTIAILGCGLDVDYPRVNRALFESVVTSGAIISEYALGSQPDSFRFPQRNRLISGLSLGTLVVEAPKQSGALITARFAAEHGRPVLVVPANIDRQNSAGSNELLKDGAIPVTETADILLALRLVPVPARSDHQLPLEMGGDEVSEDDTKKPANSRTMKSIEALIKDLPESQRLLVRHVTETPRHIDSLASAAGLSASAAGVEMTMLELAGLVRRMPGNTYILALGQ
jgi:DNA processing protein